MNALIQSLRPRSLPFSPALQMYDGLQLLFAELDRSGGQLEADHPLVSALREVVGSAKDSMAEKRVEEETRCPYCEREWS